MNRRLTILALASAFALSGCGDSTYEAQDKERAKWLREHPSEPQEFIPEGSSPSAPISGYGGRSD